MLRHAIRSSTLILIALALLACGASTREKALRGSFATLNAARDGFAKWDDQKQARIVNDATSLEQGKATLAEHRAERDKVIEGFELAYRTLASALLLEDDRSLATALEAARIVGEIVSKL